MSKSVVAGIDLGASDSYVAFVGKGIVDIVQNEVSKRATPTVVGFTDRERLLGDAALSQIRSNAKNTCRNFKHLIGRKVDAPDVQKEHFWSTSKLCECADGHAGYQVMYKGEERQMSAVEITAMYLTKLRDITEKWCEGKLCEVVIAVPSSYADAQRQAVLDAARIANIKVLRIMNEHTATALAYGIYRSNDFDPKTPMRVAFCSMGNSLFSVSIVQFVRGKLTLVCEKSDKVGGRELDECLMREFAEQFKKKVNADPLSNKKAAFKLEDAVMKTKKVLSANSEAPVTVECLMEDEDFASQITRDDLEKMCEPAMERVKTVLTSALRDSGLTPDDIDSIEMVGGGSRVPWVKKLCSEVFGGKELSTTMNAEESVARGCALQAAILSPLYKVRDFKVEDFSPFSINIGWMGPAPREDDDGDASMTEEASEAAAAESSQVFKSSTVFPAGSPVNSLKILTFFRKGPFEIKATYNDPSLLLPGTSPTLGTFKIELPPQTEDKKVKVRAKLTLHGTLSIESAQLVEEESYTETVKEKRVLPDEESSAPEDADVKMQDAKADGDAPSEPTPAAEATTEAPANGNGAAAEPEEPAAADSMEAPAAEGEAEAEGKKTEEKKEPRFEWVDVTKKKTRTNRTDLKIVATDLPGLSEERIQELMDAETAMQSEMRDIIETDERRNDLEAYIFSMRAKVAEGAEYGEFISSEDREAFMEELTKAEDWLYDTFDATKIHYIEKLDELKRTGVAVAWRCKEHGLRAEWIQAVTGTVANYRNAAENPGDKFGHIAPEKLASISTACKELEDWLADMKVKQEGLAKHEKPILICAEMEKRSQEMAAMADEILKEQKPEPPKEEKTEEAAAKDKEEESPDKAAEAPKEEEAAKVEEQQHQEASKEDMDVN